MHPTSFLEHLAYNTSYSQDTSKLIAGQSLEVQQAFLKNDKNLLANESPKIKYLANATNVIEL